MGSRLRGNDRVCIDVFEKQMTLSIAILGAGIGGFATAALLARQGHRVRVYEQAPAFARVGAGIQMAPNATKVLRALGVEDTLRQTAFQSPRMVSRVWDTGEVTSDMPMAAEAEAKFGSPYFFLHRADLHAAIAKAVPAGVVELNRKLTGVAQTAHGVTLAFADGTHAEADALIAADGVHSLVREWLLGTEHAHFTGKVAYRTTFAASRMRAEHVPRHRTKWWGPDRHMVIYPVTANRDEIYFVTSQPEKAEWRTAESWSAKGDLDELRASFAGFHAEVQAVLDATVEVHKWALFERDPLPRWCEGRITLLGDACHPMTPYMAQGAASALEDAMVLSRCLQDIDTNGIAAAFQRYEATRKPRTSQIQMQSSSNTWLKGETDPSWVYGYDARLAPLHPSNEGVKVV
jgi:2-polyprenyl-6-methoxyphenol hydroxylase-like FAD-dependent oxidoreductase